MKKYLQYFRKIDMIGPEIGLEYEENNIYKTNIGAFMTLIILKCVVVVSILFGREIYERQRPYLADSIIFQNNLDISIECLDIHIQYRVAGKAVEDINEYLEVIPKAFGFDENGNRFSNFNYSFSPCERDNEKKHCLKILEGGKKYISNESGTKNSTRLGFLINICNKNIRKCSDQVEESLYQRNFLQFNFKSNVVDKLNYSMPISEVKKIEAIPISSTLYTNSLLEFNKDSLISDNGWILENLIEYDAVTYKGLFLKYNMVTEDYPEKLWLNLSASGYKTRYSRSYLKIQDLFAKIGGILNALFFTSKILLNHYLKLLYVSNIFELNFKYNIENFLEGEIKKDSDSKNILNQMSIPNNSSIRNNNLNKRDEVLNLNKEYQKEDQITNKNLISPSLKNKNYNEKYFLSIQNEISDSDSGSYLSYLCSFICCNPEKRKKIDYMNKYHSSVFDVCTYGLIFQNYKSTVKQETERNFLKNKISNS